jgi:hypothetical protein
MGSGVAVEATIAVEATAAVGITGVGVTRVEMAEGDTSVAGKSGARVGVACPAIAVAGWLCGTVAAVQPIRTKFPTSIKETIITAFIIRQIST